MKKIALMSLVSLFSTAGFTASNFNTDTSVLEVPELNINGNTWGSAKVKLNFNNGTFTIFDANPSPKTEQPYITNGYSIYPISCNKSGTNEASCSFQIVNNLKDRILKVWSADSSYKSYLYDNWGSLGSLSNVSFGNTSVISPLFLYTLPPLIQGASNKLSFIFTGLDSKATSITSLVINFWQEDTQTAFGVQFKNINF